MSYLLFAAIVYLIFLSAILLLNYRDFTPLLSGDGNTFAANSPLVSFCIPARNEEHTIERAVTSALIQTYSSVEVLVLDDQSTDGTSDILNNLQQKYPEKLFIINGKPKPDSWLGKSWACHQLSEKARGDILFFIDADVWMEPDAVAGAVKSMRRFQVDFITVWPMQKLGSFWEKVVIPLVYYGLLSLLPVRYVYRKPAWLPSFLKDRFAPKFAAACGQCMVFSQTAYQQIGGHGSVKHEIVEDVALARQIKRHGLTMRMFHGKNTVFCRMYTSGKEIWQGFRKNFLALFNDSVSAFILMACINFMVFVFPFITLVLSIFQDNLPVLLLSVCAIILIILHRIILARWFNWSKFMALSHPVAVLWFLILAIQVLIDHLSGTGTKWKNRPIL